MGKCSILYILVLLLTFSSCKTQENRGDNQMNFSKLIFHKSRCNGTCPTISLEIDNERNIYIEREYFKTKSETDPLNSGRFKGKLSESNYTYLLNLLKNCDLDTLEFPESNIMDLSKTTLIIYYNGKQKYLKSVEIPDKAEELVNFLNVIGNNRELERTEEIRQLEY
ncbi:DUF6438 domain-containing protein [Dysgonomonas sp. 25]|uniref:DUF6438 domain-containing protein n=1 Tax=Dysgonomonas sp. 25 TaxID=2302933 RepID=UPI0013D82D6E|nr:DUF6438 domain-containing protein [Dysgonomonas sp. 25]